MRNEAAELGGDFVVYDVATGDVNRVTLSGRAFDCSAGPPKQVPIPVEVRTSGSSTAPAEPSIEERLQKLDELHKKGLITDDERAKRRDEILKGI